MKRLLRHSAGFTMLEMAVSLAVTALTMAPIAAILWQITVAPAETSSVQSVMNEVRNVDVNIPDDVRAAQRVITGNKPLWATAAWTDFTISSAKYHTVKYAWDAEGAAMVRDEAVEGAEAGSSVVGRFFDKFADADIGFRPNLPPFLLQTSITPEVNTPTGSSKREFSIVSFLRAATALPPPGGGHAVFSTGGIKVSGSDNSIIGNVHANGDITVSGSDHHVAGFLEAVQGIALSGGDPTIEFMNGVSATKALPVSFSVSAFQPFTFDFIGDVDLKSVDSVWLDTKKTQLRPGVYHSTGRIQVSGSDVKGQVTFVARDIKFSGSDSRLTPFKAGMLMFATGAESSGKAVEISGSDALWTGLIFAPQGEVKISGSRFFADGSIFSAGFDWSGSKGRIAFSPDLFQE